MAKVKPYIITIKYIASYADPAPTEEQVLNELNVDALEVTIEPVSLIPGVKSAEPVSRPVEVQAEPVAQPAPARQSKKKPSLNIKHLSEDGPSLLALRALIENGPLTFTQLRSITGRNDPSFQVALSRLKRQGRVRVIGHDNETGKSIYEFIK